MKISKIRTALGYGALALAFLAQPGLAHDHKGEIAITNEVHDSVMKKSAPAQGKRMYGDGRLRDVLRLDANGDGMISQKELIDFEMRRARIAIEKQVAKRMSAIDVDGDGMLSAAEVAIGGPVLMSPGFKPVFYNIMKPQLRDNQQNPHKPRCHFKIDSKDCGGHKPGRSGQILDMPSRYSR